MNLKAFCVLLVLCAGVSIKEALKTKQSVLFLMELTQTDEESDEEALFEDEESDDSDELTEDELDEMLEDLDIEELEAKIDASFAFMYSSEMATLTNELDNKQDELDQVLLDIEDAEVALDIETSCTDFGSCLECTLNSACVWCPDENLCVDGDIEGPTDSTCQSFEYGQCSDPDCDALTSCSVCINYSECGWCETSLVCFNADDEEAIEECEEFIQIYEDNNTCPEIEEEFDVLYSSSSNTEDDLTELNARAIDLNLDIERINEQIEELEELAEEYN